MEAPGSDISIRLKEIYPQFKDVQSQINSVLRNHPALRLQFSPSSLAHGLPFIARIRGTIEVVYQNNQYNIPIVVWLPPSFPSNAPIAMVEPTPQMEIQVSNYINSEGYFCHSYLKSWASHPRPSILEVLYIMRHIFGKMPPLLTRATHSIRPSSNTNSPAPPLPNQRPKNSVQLATDSHLFQVSKPPTLSMTSLPPTSGSLLDSDNPIGDVSQLQYKLYLKLRHASEQFNIKNSKTRSQLEYDNQRLNRNANKSRFCVSQLNQIKAQCDSNIEILHHAIANLNHTNETLNALPSVGINCIQFDKNVLTKQLTDLIAEDNSFEDTYYHLSRALSSQVIDLRTYLRSIRSLAHDQFMVRALIVKIKSQLFIP